MTESESAGNSNLTDLMNGFHSDVRGVGLRVQRGLTYEDLFNKQKTIFNLSFISGKEPRK